MKDYTQNQLKKITKKIRIEYPGVISNIKNRIQSRGIGEEVDAFIADYIDDYIKYNQGSLSFTMTALKHAGRRDPHFGIMEIIESEINKR